MPTAAVDIRRTDTSGSARLRAAAVGAVEVASLDAFGSTGLKAAAAGAVEVVDFAFGNARLRVAAAGAVEVAGLDDFAACWIHAGEAAALIRSLKYGRSTAQVTPIAARMAAVAPAAEMVTWVPCTPERRRRRGFDPAELLARALARRLDLPVRGSLRRLDQQPQTARSRAGRLAGPELRVRRARIGGRVLVVDDVCTTGSTLRTAAAALRSAGAGSVAAAVATVSGKLPTRRPRP